MEQELVWQASIWEKQAQEAQQELAIVEQELQSLRSFKEQMQVLNKSQEKSFLSSLGRGVFMKTEKQENKFFVEVGAGVLVKKTPSEIVVVLDGQISKVEEVHRSLRQRLDFLTKGMQEILSRMEQGTV